MAVTVRNAVPEDAERLLAIYAPYVETTAITFEYKVPSVQEFRERIRSVLRRYPYLVAEENGRPVGYAYAGAFHPRAAYDWCAELSIYLSPAAAGHGLGRRLYEAMEERLKAMGVLNMYACIASPETEDEYLTHNSEQFHAHMGFRLCGTFSRCGYKFGRWYNMVWMEKLIGEHTDPQPPVHAFPELEKEESL